MIPDFVIHTWGRSNDVGQDTTAGYTAANAGVMMWNGSAWVAYEDPYPTWGTGASWRPAFGNKFIELTGLTVGFCVSSVSGISTVTHWQLGKDDGYYSAAYNRVVSVGKIDGLIYWCEDHDASPTKQEILDALSAFIGHVETDLSAYNANLRVAAVIPYWVAASAADETAAYFETAGLNKRLTIIGDAQKATRLAADAVHVNKAGMDYLGERMAIKFCAKRLKHGAGTMFL